MEASQIPTHAGTHLTPSQIETLRGLLDSITLEQRSQLVTLETLVDALAAGGDETIAQREAAVVAAERAREALEETVAALRRLDDGTYGICESCGRSIPFERLEAIPEARRCVGCHGAGGFLR
jgi:DnaK suppressor protein